MKIKYAELNDTELINKYDKHIDKDEIINLINVNRIYILWDGSNLIGWLRYNLFWDNTPFMNMLFILEGYRNKKLGKKLVEHFETEMLMKGYDYVLTSTPDNETSKYFYYKLGYKEAGELNYKSDPKELILYKSLIK